MSKVSIQIRSRKTKKGDSLYLDIYIDGEREYETLGLVITPEVTRADKLANKAKMQEAELIKSKRLLEIRNGLYGFRNDDASSTMFYPYFESLAEERTSKGAKGVWHCVLGHLRDYQPKTPTFDKVGVKWIEGFIAYLKRIGLTDNTTRVYMETIRACLNHAMRADIINSNPIHKILLVKRKETKREFLTVDELKRLSYASCKYPELKRAFLLSCVTGLRWSDLDKLTWGEIHGDRLALKQQKTQQLLYLDLSEQALELLGLRGEDKQKVFNLPIQANVNLFVRRWVRSAGIDKYITFHCARHTFAMLQLEYGTDLYTVSKLLGHTNIKTTQIYAKVQDKAKKEAMDRLPRIF